MIYVSPFIIIYIHLCVCLSLQQQPSQVTKKCVQIHDSSAAAAVFAANVWQPCLSMISWAAGGGGVLVPVEQL